MSEAMSISPISPINDPDLYIEHQNQRNKHGSPCDPMDETDFPMPPIPTGPPTTLNKVFCCATDNKAGAGSRATFLGRPGSAVQIITTAAPLPAPPIVTTPDGTTHPVLHITLDDKDGDPLGGKKVGEIGVDTRSPRRVSIEQTQCVKTSTVAKNSTKTDNTSTSTKRTTTTANGTFDSIATERSGTKRSAAIAQPKANTPATSNLGATLSTITAQTSGAATATNASTGRISPSRSYDDMIKFVFTEHGIKVISDREYVV